MLYFAQCDYILLDAFCCQSHARQNGLNAGIQTLDHFLKKQLHSSSCCIDMLYQMILQCLLDSYEVLVLLS